VVDSQHSTLPQPTLGKEGPKHIAEISIPYNPSMTLYFCNHSLDLFGFPLALSVVLPILQHGTVISHYSHWGSGLTLVNVIHNSKPQVSLYRSIKLWGGQWPEESQKKPERRQATRVIWVFQASYSRCTDTQSYPWT